MLLFAVIMLLFAVIMLFCCSFIVVLSIAVSGRVGELLLFVFNFCLFVFIGGGGARSVLRYHVV